MKRATILLFTMIAAAALWYVSIIMVSDKFFTKDDLLVNASVYAIINSLFLCLAIAAIAYAIIALTFDLKICHRAIEGTMHSNKLHLEVVALTSLIQECDITLHRYDRWEEAGIRGDYASAKADVREKMNAHKEKLESKLQEIQSS